MKRRTQRVIKPLGIVPRPKPNGTRQPKPSIATSLALVQFAPTKGDIDANLAAIGDAFVALKRDRAPFPNVVVLPEACLSGYFVEGAVREVALTSDDLFNRLRRTAAKTLGASHPSFDIVAGFYEVDGGKLYNSALYATLGKDAAIRHVHRKLFLATYGVFDEERFVSRGRTIEAFDTPYGRAAILICEDACHSLSTTIAALRGAQILYIPSASPGRGLEDAEPANVRLWRDITRVAAAEHGIFIAYSGLLGFEGGKGFTGSSRLIGPFGDLRAEAPFDTPAILRVDVDPVDLAAARAALPMLGDLEANLAELTAMLDDEAALRPRPRQRPKPARRR
ncbi:MAG TPA: nitrilase-related carbon-nitrogen hydrolase [Candidatus Eremiobacteraceae bacterium]|nr:nitrilase-related carbon-nitrogen hydrolase [Candidatus Eremiobacteraceae bacterium]